MFKISYEISDLDSKPGDESLHRGLDSFNFGNYKSAFASFQDAASVNNEFGLLFVASFYVLGLGMNMSDPAKSIDYYEKAAKEYNNSVAQYMLGAIYVDGAKGVCVSARKGTEWLLKAIENGNKDAYVQMALLYQEGVRASGNFRKAISWYEKVLKQKTATTTEDTLYMFDNKKFPIKVTNEKDMFEYPKQARLAGFLAPLKIARTFEEDYYNNKEETLFFWLVMTGIGPHSSIVQKSIGEMYYKGDESQPFDVKKAVYWYLQAAIQEEEISQFRLGEIYENGLDGVNYKASMNWYLKAMDNGQYDAPIRIGELYYRGDGVAKDYKKAMEFFELAFRKNQKAKVAYIMGSMYKEGGYGLKRDEWKSVYYMKIASSLGYGDVAAHVGNYYYFGQCGHRRDPEEAIEWYQKSVNMNSIAGCVSLGLMFQKGDYVEQDYTMAIRLFKKAKELGSDDIAPKLIDDLRMTIAMDDLRI